MIPTIAQVSSLNSPMETDLADYAAGACRSVELWLGKLETFLEHHPASDVRRLLEEHNLAAPVASYQGGLLISQGPARQQHWESFARRLGLCRDLGIGTIVIAGDMTGPMAQEDLERAQLSLRQAAQKGEQHGVRVALEFQGKAAFGNNLQTAAALVHEVGSPWLGLCLDVFHYYLGPSKAEDLVYLSNDNLFHVQLSDVAGQPREFMSDSDRILPGDGDFQLAPLVEHLQTIGYTGAVSVELMNPQIWQISPRQFGEIAMTALRKVLGQATME